MEKKICEGCRNEFHRPSYRHTNKEWAERRFCSNKCAQACLKDSTRFKAGAKPWNKGLSGYMSKEGRMKVAMNGQGYLKKETPEQKAARYKKIVASRNKNDSWNLKGKPGKEHPSWLDNNATYNAKHRWIQKHWVKSGVCEDCGAKPAPFGKRKHGTEWANLDGEYNRNDRLTWKELCVPCHRKLDKVE